MPSATPFLRAAAACALLAATLAVPSISSAGETESRSLFAEGRELRMKGKCADAIPLFRRALDTYPEGLGSLRNVAECEEELERFASARRSYWDLRLAALQSTTTKYEGWDKDAEQKHAALGTKVAKVTVVFKGQRPEGLVIRFNGKPFDPRLVGVEIEQDNGPLEVSVSFGAGPPSLKKVDVTTAGRHVVEFDLADLPRPSADTTRPPEEKGSGDGMRIGGFVALGVGAAGLIGTGIMIGVRQGALGALEDNDCTENDDGYTCPPGYDFESDKSTGDTASLLTNVFIATAIVGAGVGVTLLVLAPSGDDQTGAAPRTTMAVSPLPGGAFLNVEGAL